AGDASIGSTPAETPVKCDRSFAPPLRRSWWIEAPESVVITSASARATADAAATRPGRLRVPRRRLRLVPTAMHSSVPDIGARHQHGAHLAHRSFCTARRRVFTE